MRVNEPTSLTEKYWDCPDFYMEISNNLNLAYGEQRGHVLSTTGSCAVMEDSQLKNLVSGTALSTSQPQTNGEGRCSQE